jgi:hypothetical protein
MPRRGASCGNRHAGVLQRSAETGRSWMSSPGADVPWPRRLLEPRREPATRLEREVPLVAPAHQFTAVHRFSASGALDGSPATPPRPGSALDGELWSTPTRRTVLIVAVLDWSIPSPSRWFTREGAQPLRDTWSRCCRGARHGHEELGAPSTAESHSTTSGVATPPVGAGGNVTLS